MPSTLAVGWCSLMVGMLGSLQKITKMINQRKHLKSDLSALLSMNYFAIFVKIRLFAG
jgi:hypothetical protein